MEEVFLFWVPEEVELHALRVTSARWMCQYWARRGDWRRFLCFGFLKRLKCMCCGWTSTGGSGGARHVEVFRRGVTVAIEVLVAIDGAVKKSAVCGAQGLRKREFLHFQIGFCRAQRAFRHCHSGVSAVQERRLCRLFTVVVRSDTDRGPTEYRPWFDRTTDVVRRRNGASGLQRRCSCIAKQLSAAIKRFSLSSVK